MLSPTLTQHEVDCLESKKMDEMLHDLYLDSRVIFVNKDYLDAEKKQLGGRVIREIQLANGCYALKLA